MTRVGIYRSMLVLSILWNSFVMASDTSGIEKAKFSPIDAMHATWVFSGIVTNEIGENYGYFFQLQRNAQHFHATAALVDEVSKHIVLREDSEVDIEENTTPYDWHIGRIFLRFNAINHNWIFGVKSKDNLGFNFKVDMLKQDEGTPSLHHLRPGVTMMVIQTSELNGHVMTGDARPEQFVTADDAWFRQIWQDAQDETVHRLNNVLCRFNDGSGFYSVNLQEPDTTSGSVVGLYNAKGIRQVMSQFIKVSQIEKGHWRIQSQSPQLDLVLSHVLEQNSVIAGFIEGNKKPGFCMLNNNLLSIQKNESHEFA